MTSQHKEDTRGDSARLTALHTLQWRWAAPVVSSLAGSSGAPSRLWFRQLWVLVRRISLTVRCNPGQNKQRVLRLPRPERSFRVCLALFV